ncbi:hypothetical protein [Pelagicoccus sp. SDUM812002]|uniref:hypothetical protein n=1 Tax=Pelagicoccus sp. SDUM812002 TaxID=3041266 RepID=UPI00280D6648|nr:hypothetical protein [Pelagicoccus sp. SDUM812002]MDQ8184960.1 hypothetical protein [Pelagicoccus sp. SDUM812002]
MKIAHVVNPVKVGSDSDLFVAQPVTFETMRRAKAIAAPLVDVELMSVQYSEDNDIVPDDFRTLPELETSVLDLGIFQRPRKLPILRHILDRAYQATDADYLIYTNVDIALMPHFYLSVANLLQENDGLVINRRTISDSYQSPDQIPLMWAEAGRTHGGFDCFVFRRDAYPKFELADTCIGTKGIGVIAYANVVAHSRSFQLLTEAHLTFHIGNDMSWTSSSLSDYMKHNYREVNAGAKALRSSAGPLDATTPHGRFLLDRYHKAHHYYLNECLKLDNSDSILAPRKNKRHQPNLKSMLGKIKRRIFLYHPSR